MLARLVTAVTFSLAVVSTAEAQYPNRPIRLIVPAAPGGGTDITTRGFAPALQDHLGQPVGKPYVAVDTVDAGAGDLVLIAAGSSARQTTITKDSPVDAVIMAVIDSLEVNGQVTFRKE